MKKKNKSSPPLPNTFKNWGAFQASARFRGVLVLLLVLLLSLSGGANLYLSRELLSRGVVYLGVDNQGSPHLLEATSAPDPKLFSQLFLSLFASYSSVTLEDNTTKLIPLTTPQFRQIYSRRFEESFTSEVKVNRQSQVFTYWSGELVSLQPKTAKVVVRGLLTRSSNLHKEPQERKITYEIDLFRSTPDQENPWGYKVLALREKGTTQ